MKSEEIKQIKDLIKQAVALLGNGGSSITLSNADDCSLFVSNLFGYRNWQEVKSMVKYEDKKKLSFNKLNSFVDDKILDMSPLTFHSVDIKTRKHSYSTFKSSISLTKNIYRETFDFAYTEDEYLKTLNALEFGTCHTIVIAKNNQEKLMNMVIEDLEKFKTPYVCFSSDPNISLDPWATMLRTNQLEAFFFNKKDSFSAILIQIIRDLQSVNIGIDLQEIISWLEISNLLSLKKVLEEKNLVSYQFLSAFINSLGIKTTEGSVIDIESQKKYWSKVANAYNILCYLNDFYEKGVFKKLYGEDEILNAVELRQILKIDSRYLDNDFYLEVIRLELERVFTVYGNSIESSEDQYLYWFFLDGVDNSNFSWSWLYDYKFINTLFAAAGNKYNIDEYVLNSTQILIGSNISLEMGMDVKEKLLNSVISWPAYFWKDKCSILSLLKDDEYFLISPKMLTSGERDFKDCYCRKITLMNSQDEL